MAENEVIVKLLLANNQFLSQLSESKKKTEAFAKSSASSFSSFGKILTGAAVLGALYKIKTETDEYQKSQARLNAVIASTGSAAGVTAQAANELAQKLSNITAIDDDVIVGAEAILLRFKSMSKEAFPQATQAALDFAAATGKDLNSSALAVGKALDSQASGLTALNKAGAGFTEQQKKQIEVMQKAGNVAGANKIIFEQMNKSFGGQAAAQANTLDGAINRIKNSMGNLAATIGNEATPGLIQFSKALTDLGKDNGFFSKQFVQFGRDISEFFYDIGLRIKQIEQASAAISYWWSKGRSVSERAGLKLEWIEATKALREYEKGYADLIKKSEKLAAKVPAVAGGGDTNKGKNKDKEDEEKKLKDMQKRLADSGVETVRAMTSNISSILTNVYEQTNRAFDKFVEMADSGFEYLKNVSLKAAGVAEKTAIENNAAEINTLQRQIAKTNNIKEKKERRDQLNTKIAEQKKLKITEDYNRAKMVFDELMHMKKNALLKRQFENEKAMKLAQAGIDMAAGIAGAWVSALSMVFPPLVIAFGAVMTALIVAAGVTSMATIASQKFTPLATGTTNVPHDMPAIVHQGEIIVPRPFAESIRSGEATLGGGGGGDIVLEVNGRNLGRVTREENSRFARRLGIRSYAMARAY